MALTDNLVAYFKLDETSGNAIDVVNSYVGTNVNTVTYGVGKLGNAGSFVNASSQKLTAASNANLQGGNVDHTLSAWVMLGTTLPSSALVVKHRNSGPIGDYKIDYLGTQSGGFNAFRFGVMGTTDVPTAAKATTFGSASPNVWIFVVGWWDQAGSTMNIQVNNGGVDSSAITIGSTLPTAGTEPFQIGAYPDAGNELYLTGMVDEVGFWKRLLTAAERTTLYNAGNGLSYPFPSSTGLQSKIW